MTSAIPTEPIGSIPRPPELLQAVRDHAAGKTSLHTLEGAYDDAIKKTIRQFEATGSPIITDGEQSKPSFATYPVAGGRNVIESGGLVVTFSDRHVRALPKLTSGPFRYQQYASDYVKKARGFTSLPLKQAVISASLLSTLYPEKSIQGYSREAFTEDLIQEVTKDISGSLRAGAEVVQVDFTEAPLARKLDPGGKLLKEFVAINNEVFSRLKPGERERVGVHVCKGGDWDSTHSGEVDYAEVLPEVFELKVPRFYFAIAGEADLDRTLKLLADYVEGRRKIFVGVTNPISTEQETPEVVERRVIKAAKFIDLKNLGTTDDCGFAPFGDDSSTSRELAFAKIRARVDGTRRAEKKLR